MQKVNARDVPDLMWASPGGKFAGAGKQISEALGRDPKSTDIMKRHPFDVEISTLKAGQIPFPYHSHSAQWEFYYILSGSGSVRHEQGTTRVESGDAFLFKPGEAHVIFNDGAEDLVYIDIADNPIGESCHYPDSGKWAVESPESRIVRSEALDYYDGEE